MSDKPEENLLKQPGLEAAVLIPNLLLLLVIVFYLLITKVGPDRILPLVATDQQTSARIRELERQLTRNPRDRSAAIALARLYQRAGQLPFSYDALRGAEQNGSRHPIFRLKLGMAFVEIGKNKDGQRVLREALSACELRRSCPAHVRARLSIFSQIADLMTERQIDSRRQPAAAAKVFDDVLKKVDAKGLRPPRQPAAGSAATRPSGARKATPKR